MYSILIIDIDTILYILLLYKTTTLFKIKIRIIINVQFLKLFAKLLFMYLIKLYRSRFLRSTLSRFLYINSSCIVIFKYEITFL